MALKKKISKEDFAKLPEHFKGEYIEDGDAYRLDVDGDEDTGALKRAKDREKDLRKAAEQKLTEALEEIENLKTSTDPKKFESKIANLTNFATKSLIDGSAKSLATKISTVPALMEKALRERITVDFSGETPVQKILDANGKVSNMTLEDLEKEFVANKEFSSIIIGSKASGGGAPKDGQNTNGGGAPKTDATGKPISLASLSAKDHVAMIKASKEN